MIFATSDADDDGTPTEHMRLDSYGQLLIGRTDYLFDAEDGILLAPAGWAYFERTIGGTGSSVLYVHRRDSIGSLIDF